jgi:hypothetical protein
MNFPRRQRKKILYFKGKILKPTKHCLKQKGEGKLEWKYNRGEKVVQGTPYTCMEFSQWNSYANSNIKLKNILRTKNKIIQ